MSEAVEIIGLGHQNTDMNVRATLQTLYLRGSGTGIPACVAIFLQLLRERVHRLFRDGPLDHERVAEWGGGPGGAPQGGGQLVQWTGWRI